ncbi:hypothetical protein L9F63_005869, partial [Diploptera punctata]
ILHGGSGGIGKPASNNSEPISRDQRSRPPTRSRDVLGVQPYFRSREESEGTLVENVSQLIRTSYRRICTRR